MKKIIDIAQLDTALRNEWFASYGSDNIDFIYDGATDISEWLSSPWKIMCLYKEAHGGGIWNHAEEIKKCDGLLRVGGTANQSIHYRTIEWLYTVESALSGKSFDVESDRNNKYPAAKKTMLRSAWVNLKKADGVPYSNNENLAQVAERDSKFLLRQINMLNPRFILCGKTFDIAKKYLFPNCTRLENTEFSYYEEPTGRIIFDYGHPGRKSRDSYKPLAAEVERIKKTKRFAELEH